MGPEYCCYEQLDHAFPDRSGARFFDMDGVLAIYERDAYRIESSPGKKLYEDERMHYFRTCRPDPVALELFERSYRDGYRTYALTSVRPDLPWARLDKIWWLARYAPWFDPSTRLIVASGDKAQVAMALMRATKLTRAHVLLDDFNQNLCDWANAGGKAIKYLNGVNTPGTFPGAQYRPDYL